MSVELNKLKILRKEIHSNPELSGFEKETSEKVSAFLKECNPDEIITNIGGYGIIATWNGSNTGKEIILRAELDALPIEEINQFDYKSKKKNISHKCGHDGHTTILCGVAQYLSSHNPNHKVRLLFQPAEENGEGAKAMMEDKLFSNIKPDFIFALHNLPGYSKNEIVVKENTFTPAVKSIIINLKGKTSHAAEPEHGINPALAVSEILKECLALENNDADKDDMSVITPVYIELGEKAYGISAGEATVHFTIRCWTNENLDELQKQIENKSSEIALKYNLKIHFDYTQIFHANINTAEAVDYVKRSAVKNNLKLTEKKYPFKWGEDFGLFTSNFKGCMFGIGSGEDCPALHNPDYDFPDEIIETGINIFRGILEEIK